MSYVKHQFKASDGAGIVYHKWSAETEDIRAVVVIAHGMAEHAFRYNHFANVLNENYFTVYAPDHRGHGCTAGDPENTGIFARRQGWWKVVDDLHSLIGIVKNENPGKKVFLLGHSMGSFLVRTYICTYGNHVHGVILSGTGMNPRPILVAGSMIARLSSFFKGQNHRSKTLDMMSFGSFNKKYSTPFQWLSRDQEMVDKYIADPYCGQVFTSGFFQDLFCGLRFIGNINNLSEIPKSLPVFIVSGSDDPVGNYGKAVTKVYALYQKAGLRNVEMKLYPGARHEILNETNRDEIMIDIINWLKHKNLYA
ncbi:MAG TPA: lysophospholipase [Bacteroidales bacterium]|nr:lysophospholipase [Bacteroidales bacterium]HQL71149.1 lysophospholipase [Bacteroidales bacterium]